MKNHRRTGKHDKRWVPYYRIIEQTGPVSFIVKNQLNGTTTKAHARHLHHAKLDEWEIPQNLGGRVLRQTQYVVPPENVSEEENSDDEGETSLQRLVSQK